jgi:hypothetical protein
MQFERGKPPETPNVPYRAARVKDERSRSGGPGFEPGRIARMADLRPSQGPVLRNRLFLRQWCGFSLTVDLALFFRRAPGHFVTLPVAGLLCAFMADLFVRQ